MEVVFILLCSSNTSLARSLRPHSTLHHTFSPQADDILTQQTYRWSARSVLSSSHSRQQLSFALVVAIAICAVLALCATSADAASSSPDSFKSCGACQAAVRETSKPHTTSKTSKTSHSLRHSVFQHKHKHKHQGHAFCKTSKGNVCVANSFMSKMSCSEVYTTCPSPPMTTFWWIVYAAIFACAIA